MSAPADLYEVRKYVAGDAALQARVGPVDTAANWSVTEVGDGNINFVYIITGAYGGICIKKALSFVRCVGKSWSLTKERLRIEATALQEQYRHCPAHVPQVYVYDPTASVMALQYLPPPFQIVRKGLIEGRIYPFLAKQVAHFLATTLFNTSLLRLSTAQFRQQGHNYHNQEMCKLTEDVIFTEPYMDCPNNRWTQPHLDSGVLELRSSSAVRVAISGLKAKFCQNAEALIHGDFHTGSIMATAEAMFVIDAEFAFVGPMAFDIGKIIANLLLAFFATDGLCQALNEEANSRQQQQGWLLACVQSTWELFHQEFAQLWDQHGGTGDLYPRVFMEAAGSTEQERAAVRRDVQNHYLNCLYHDVVAFAGACMIRRLVGIAHIAEMEAITVAELRAPCERRALSFGIRLLVERGCGEFASISQVTAAATACRQEAS